MLRPTNCPLLYSGVTENDGNVTMLLLIYCSQIHFSRLIMGVREASGEKRKQKKGEKKDTAFTAS